MVFYLCPHINSVNLGMPVFFFLLTKEFWTIPYFHLKKKVYENKNTPWEFGNEFIQLWYIVTVYTTSWVNGKNEKILIFSFEHTSVDLRSFMIIDMRTLVLHNKTSKKCLAEISKECFAEILKNQNYCRRLIFFTVSSSEVSILSLLDLVELWTSSFKYLPMI